MSTEDLDALLERMPRIAEAVNTFNSETVQQEAFLSLVAAFNGTTARTLTDALPQMADLANTEPESLNGPSEQSMNSKQVASGKQKRRKSGSTRADWTLNKDLELHPSGKPSIEVFIEQKQPKSNEDRYAVVVYYLEEILQLSPITRNEVGTVFRRMPSWQEPANVGSGLRVTQNRKATVNCSNLEDIKITPAGRNFVEHKLPHKAAAAK